MNLDHARIAMIAGVDPVTARRVDPVGARMQDYTTTRDRYAAALRFAATCSPIHRPRAMQAVDRCAADHRVNVARLNMIDPGVSDPRD